VAACKNFITYSIWFKFKANRFILNLVQQEQLYYTNRGSPTNVKNLIFYVYHWALGGLLILIELNLWHLKASTKAIPVLLLDFAVPREVALRCTFCTRALFKVVYRFLLADTGTGNEQTNKVALCINYSM
jgi:hypothetical protein